MRKEIEVTGKTEDEALAQALAQLGLERDDVSVEIVQRSKAGFLGLGATPAIVKVSYDAEEETPAVEAAPAPVREGSQEERVRAFLTGLLAHMGVEAEMHFGTRENGGLVVNLSGPGMGAVIGRRGETLDAIQHLTNYTVNRGQEKRAHISVDAENYRSKREDSLVRLAEKMAAKVVKYRRSMALEPMNSYERHVIHTALQDYAGVSTASSGTEPNRRVVVSYVGQSPEQTQKPRSREWA